MRSVQRQPERLESPVRKWLTYITLVITASTIIADVVKFLAYFLRGDLSPRIALKVVTVVVIAGGVFAHYLDSLRRDTVFSTRNRIFGFAALTIVALAIVVGFVQIGSPARQRAGSEDARRLFDLSTLAKGLHGRWLTRGERPFVLAVTIQELQTTVIQGTASILDPVSGQRYEYVLLRGDCLSSVWHVGSSEPG